jgi:hypothetical protein
MIPYKEHGFLSGPGTGKKMAGPDEIRRLLKDIKKENKEGLIR